MRRIPLAVAMILVTGTTAFAGPATAPDVPVNRWLLRFTQNPNTIHEDGIAYDPVMRRVVEHGGHIGRLYPQSGYTHLFDLARDRFFESQAFRRPPRRCLVSVDYIDLWNRAVTCNGGSAHGSIPAGAVGGDYTKVGFSDPRGPWLYDAGADEWEDCRTIPPAWERRAHNPLAYDPSSDALFHLGKKELEFFCARTNRVYRRAMPEALHDRLGHGIVVDPVRRVLVVFGGTGGGGYMWHRELTREQSFGKYVTNDTWLYDIVADKWTQAHPKVSPTAGMPMHDYIDFQMDYHDPSGTIILHQNGVEGYQPDANKWGPSQVWSFDVASAQWTRLEVANPTPYVGRMVYARQEDLFIEFGGGDDAIADGGKGVDIDASRHIYTLRLAVPGRKVAPAAPPRVTLVTSADSATLTWPVGETTTYDVYRAQIGPDALPGAYGTIGKGAGPFTDRDLKPGTLHAYRICVSGSTESPSLPVFTQPFRPSGLLASVEDAKKVVLTWKASSETDLVGYKVYRADGKELESGKGTLLTDKPLDATTLTDTQVDLSDGIIRSYWVTAINRLGVESGASPLAYTAPDAPGGLRVCQGVDPSNGVGVWLAYDLNWDWPAGVKVKGFNLYHARLHTNGYRAELWSKVNSQPIVGPKFAFKIDPLEYGRIADPDAPISTQPDVSRPQHHYFYVRAVNILGQEGLYTDIMSPTDRRFRP